MEHSVLCIYGEYAKKKAKQALDPLFLSEIGLIKPKNHLTLLSF